MLHVLTDVIQNDLAAVATKLYAKGLISQNTHENAMNQHQILRDRTVSLLSAVHDKIRAEPQVFTEFVKILESESTLKPVAKTLAENYQSDGKWESICMDISHGVCMMTMCIQKDSIRTWTRLNKLLEATVVTIRCLVFLMLQTKA